MRKSAVIAVIFCSVIVLFSCDESDTMATVKIDLSGNAAILPQQQQPDTIIDRVLRFFSTPAYAAPAEVKLIVVTATGKDMVPVVKTFEPSTRIASLTVSEGKNRFILVKGYNGIGRAIYAGKKLVDLKAGEVKYVSLTMRKTLRQIADLNPSGDSSPYGFTLFNKKVYFSATDATYGRELWFYNPLTEAVGRVTDINTTGDSNPTGLTVFQNRLYFRASDDDSEYDLWVYDEANGAQKANDFVAGNSDDPANLTVIDNKLYFSVNTESSPLNIEMCIYDGVTFAIVDVYPGSASSNPANFIKFNNEICFSIWVDGTSSNFCTYNIDSGLIDTYINFNYMAEVLYLTRFDDKIYFSANEGSPGYELYRYDGNTVEQVIDLYTTGGSNPSYLSVVDDFLFFLAADDGVSTGFWGYNGAEPAVAGVNLRLTSDLVAEGIINPESVSAINHVLYFRGDFLSQSYLLAYIPLLDIVYPVMQTQIGQDSIKKLGSTAVTFTEGDEATDIYVLDPSSALGTGSFPAPVKLALDADGTVYNRTVIGNYIFFDGGATDGRELWIYEHYDPIE